MFQEVALTTLRVAFSFHVKVDSCFDTICNILGHLIHNNLKVHLVQLLVIPTEIPIVLEEPLLCRPQVAIDGRMVKCKQGAGVEVLIQWEGKNVDYATWTLKREGEDPLVPTVSIGYK